MLPICSRRGSGRARRRENASGSSACAESPAGQRHRRRTPFLVDRDHVTTSVRPWDRSGPFNRACQYDRPDRLGRRGSSGPTLACRNSGARSPGRYVRAPWSVSTRYDQKDGQSAEEALSNANGVLNGRRSGMITRINRQHRPRGGQAMCGPPFDHGEEDVSPERPGAGSNPSRRTFLERSAATAIVLSTGSGPRRPEGEPIPRAR